MGLLFRDIRIVYRYIVGKENWMMMTLITNYVVR